MNSINKFQTNIPPMGVSAAIIIFFWEKKG